MVEEIKKYREIMTIMIDDLKEKQERIQILEEEKSKLPRNINRLISNLDYSLLLLLLLLLILLLLLLLLFLLLFFLL